MHFATALLLTAAATIRAAPQASQFQDRQASTAGVFSASNADFVSLIPEFGVQQGINPTGTGDCDGFNAALKKVVKIPCAKCPPTRDAFINVLSTYLNNGANVFGEPITFNPDPSVQDVQTNKDRATACIVAFQSLDMTTKGSGCPAVAAPNFALQQQTGVRNDQQFVPVARA